MLASLLVLFSANIESSLHGASAESSPLPSSFRAPWIAREASKAKIYNKFTTVNNPHSFNKNEFKIDELDVNKNKILVIHYSHI